MKETVSGAIAYIDSMTELDHLLFQQDDVHNIPINKQREYLFEQIRQNFDYHYRNNEQYRNYCERFKFGTDQLHSIHDLQNIPLLPSTIFKKNTIYTNHLLDIEKKCESSGTQGGKSTIYRDRTTLDRFLGTILSMYQLAPDIKFKNPFLYVLSPDTDEAQDLWLAYVLSMVEILHPSKFYVRAGKLNHEELLRDLQKIGKDHQSVLIGPPQLLNQLADIVQDSLGSLNLGSNNGYIITAGGWKKHRMKR